LAGAADPVTSTISVGVFPLTSLEEFGVSAQAWNARRLSVDRAGTGEQHNQDLFGKHV
jgi:hypothetical protein